jgi:hypothetical protein
MKTSTHAASREGDTVRRAASVAIGRELRAVYVPVTTQPLPRTLEDLVAKIIALEALAWRSPAVPASASAPVSAVVIPMQVADRTH